MSERVQVPYESFLFSAPMLEGDVKRVARWRVAFLPTATPRSLPARVLWVLVRCMLWLVVDLRVTCVGERYGTKFRIECGHWAFASGIEDWWCAACGVATEGVVLPPETVSCLSPRPNAESPY